MINQEDQDLELEFYKNRVIELEQCLTDILSMSKYISEPISRRINLCYNNSSTLESRPVSKDVIETTRLLTQEELPAYEIESIVIGSKYSPKVRFDKPNYLRYECKSTRNGTAVEVTQESPEEIALAAWKLTYNNRSKRVDYAE